MKKELLLIAAAATMLTACVNTEDFRDHNIQQDSENDGAIGFTSFTEKITKGLAENSEALYTWTFYDHQSSFKVWGRKAGQATHEIFNGTTVTVTPSAVGYTYAYSPARFWDKSAAKYHFYAAAPADDSWTFNGGTDIIADDATLGKGYFTTTATLNGVNLQSKGNSGPTANLKNIFKTATVDGSETKDIDKLIAAPCEVSNTYYNRATPNAVNLNFIHILSKLNITISTSLYDASNEYYDVDLLGFEVCNIPNVGSFNENTVGFTEHGKNIRWTLTEPASNKTSIYTGINATDKKVDVAEPTGAGLKGAKQYIVESLIIPQNIDYERVALDGQEHALVPASTVPFTDYQEYTQATHDDVPRLTKAQFDALFASAGVFKEWTDYTDIEGENLKSTADGEETFNDRIAEATKTQDEAIAAYATPTKPYFKIKYSIDGDIFEQYYNLAAAFLNYNNNNQKYTNAGLVDLTSEPTTFGFYEGWQNTLNIIINPTAIEFTADVAEWVTNANVEYEIEKGNENPNN